MDILRRNLAPITDEAWAEIDEEATRTLRGNLSARSLVDFSGPHGWEMGALNLGRVTKEKAIQGVEWGLREMKPLMEIRVPFTLDQQELDTVIRGSKDPELDAVQEAARKVANFEEKALYGGFPKGSIQGIGEASPHGSVKLQNKPEGVLDAVESAVMLIQQAAIGGPYHLVLGTNPYGMVMKSVTQGGALRRRIEEMTEGKVHWSPALIGGVLLSARGGDYELTVGQDLSIGYTSQDTKGLHFYITESFTFQVLEPAAAVRLTANK